MSDNNKQLIRIAHSPDTDDIFMFYALTVGATGRSPLTHPDFHFEICAKDIEELNQLAQKEVYDITAISFHAYAHLTDKYALTTSGASVAEKNYGPLIVAKEKFTLAELKHKMIAVPGEMTTAFLLLKIIMPECRHIVMPPTEILGAIARDEVTAGLLIHEGQIQYAKMGLKIVHTLMNSWRDFVGDLPLPLGGNAIKKSLGIATLKTLSALQKKSILYGLEHHTTARNHCLRVNPVLTPAEADEYLSWYVNDRTVDFGPDGRKALEKLYDLAFERGLLKEKFEIEIV